MNYDQISNFPLAERCFFTGYCSFLAAYTTGLFGATQEKL